MKNFHRNIFIVFENIPHGFDDIKNRKDEETMYNSLWKNI